MTLSLLSHLCFLFLTCWGVPPHYNTNAIKMPPFPRGQWHPLLGAMCPPCPRNQSLCLEQSVNPGTSSGGSDHIKLCNHASVSSLVSTWLSLVALLPRSNSAVAKEVSWGLGVLPSTKEGRCEQLEQQRRIYKQRKADLPDSTKPLA